MMNFVRIMKKQILDRFSQFSLLWFFENLTFLENSNLKPDVHPLCSKETTAQLIQHLLIFISPIIRATHLPLLLLRMSMLWVGRRWETGQEGKMDQDSDRSLCYLRLWDSNQGGTFLYALVWTKSH